MKAIRRGGWKTVTVQGFLALSDEDMAIIEERIALAKQLRTQSTRAEKDGRTGRKSPRTRGGLVVIGESGRISLGKSYAGKAFRVEHRRNGAILLTPVAEVPENQLWTLKEPHRSRIRRGLAWAATTTRSARTLIRHSRLPRA